VLIHETNLLSLINPSLAHVYCSTTWSNHELISLMDSSRELASIYAIGFVIRLYLIVLIGVQTSDGMGLKFSRGEPNRL
jgi:hypothetical protein